MGYEVLVGRMEYGTYMIMITRGRGEMSSMEHGIINQLEVER